MSEESTRNLEGRLNSVGRDIDAEEFANPPAWVTVVQGMELYVDDWMRFAVE